MACGSVRLALPSQTKTRANLRKVSKRNDEPEERTKEAPKERQGNCRKQNRFLASAFCGRKISIALRLLSTSSTGTGKYWQLLVSQELVSLRYASDFVCPISHRLTWAWVTPAARVVTPPRAVPWPRSDPGVVALRKAAPRIEPTSCTVAWVFSAYALHGTLHRKLDTRELELFALFAHSLHWQ
jgi:hypothetical protein